MARDLDAAFISALQERVFRPAVYLYLDWPTGAVRVSNGVGDDTWGGYTWQGVGEFGRVSAIEEGAEIASRPIALTLFGVAPADVSLISTDRVRGRDAILYMAPRDANLVRSATPDVIYPGVMTGFTFGAADRDGQLAHALTVTADVSVRAIRRTKSITYAHPYQSRLPEQAITWPS